MAQSSRDLIRQTLRQGTTVSGQQLADNAGISRTAVWKHIRALRREGYAIESIAGSGYCLRSVPEGLPAREIQAGLSGSLFGQRIVSLSGVDSTQRVAAELALEGCREGTVVLAERQASGRGRVRRLWHSLPGSLALSAVLRPSVLPGQAAIFPLLAGVACASGIAEATGLKAGLKWPNDVMLQGRKAGGILAEMSGELDRIEHLIIGLGLNLNTPAEAFPEDIRNTATSLRLAAGRKIGPVRLVQALLRHLEQEYLAFQRFGPDRTLRSWREVSTTLGRRVTVHRPGGDIPGLARDIDDQGGLIVETDSGLLTVSAGDVSLREETRR